MQCYSKTIYVNGADCNPCSYTVFSLKAPVSGNYTLGAFGNLTTAGSAKYSIYVNGKLVNSGGPSYLVNFPNSYNTFLNFQANQGDAIVVQANYYGLLMTNLPQYVNLGALTSNDYCAIVSSLNLPISNNNTICVTSSSVSLWALSGPVGAQVGPNGTAPCANPNEKQIKSVQITNSVPDSPNVYYQLYIYLQGALSSNAQTNLNSFLTFLQGEGMINSFQILPTQVIVNVTPPPSVDPLYFTKQALAMVMVGVFNYANPASISMMAIPYSVSVTPPSSTPITPPTPTITPPPITPPTPTPTITPPTSTPTITPPTPTPTITPPTPTPTTTTTTTTTTSPPPSTSNPYLLPLVAALGVGVIGAIVLTRRKK